MHTIEGVFLQAISWQFKDETTGELRHGTTIRVGSMPNGSEYNRTKGFVITKYTGPSTLMATIEQKLVGQAVEVVGQLVPNSKGFKFVPEEVRPSKRKAQAA
jgi:hypothetical protein